MKKIRLTIIVLFMGFLLVCCESTNEEIEPEHFNWNGGYCELDGGRLSYLKTGSKEHYKCEICGKEYVFDEVGKYIFK